MDKAVVPQIKMTLNVRTGSLRFSSGQVRALDVEAMITLYWTLLGAPDVRLAKALGIEEREVPALRSRLFDLLKVCPEDFDSIRAEFEGGSSPRPSRPWNARTLTRLVDDGLASRDANDVLVDVAGGISLTVSDVRFIVQRMRAGFRQAGCHAGDYIAADATSCVEVYLITLAAHLHGAILVRLSDSASPSQLLDHLCNDSPSICFTARADELSPGRFSFPTIRLDDGREGDTFQSFEDWLESTPAPTPADCLAPEVNPMDIASICFTSGSTGLPKPVRISHESAWFNADRFSRLADFNSDEVYASSTDFTSNIGQYLMVAMPFLCGGRVLIPSRESRSSPLSLAIDCEAHGVTCLRVVPSVLRVMLGAEQGTDEFRLNSIERLFSGASPLDRDLLASFEARYSCPLIDSYGSRESGSIISTVCGCNSLLAAGGGLSVETMIRVLDSNGDVAKAGEVGDIHVHGCGTMTNRADPASEGSTSDSGCQAGRIEHSAWHPTGDVGRYASGEKIEILGRTRDMLKLQDGDIAYSRDIESVLQKSAHVREASVFNAIDSAGYEVLCAAVTRTGGLDDETFRHSLRQDALRELGHLKTPKHILICREFPRIALGKVDKIALEALATEKLSVGQGE